MNIALLEMRITVLEFERELAEKWVKENGGERLRGVIHNTVKFTLKDIGF